MKSLKGGDKSVPVTGTRRWVWAGSMGTNVVWCQLGMRMIVEIVHPGDHGADARPAGKPRAAAATLEIDTGATHSSLDRGLVERLGLPCVGARPTRLPDGSTETFPAYSAVILLPMTSGLVSRVCGWEVLVTADEWGGRDIQGLLGRSFLRLFDLNVSGPKGVWTLAHDEDNARWTPCLGDQKVPDAGFGP